MKKEIFEKVFTKERLQKEVCSCLFYGEKGVGKRHTVFEIIKNTLPLELHSRIHNTPDILELKGNESFSDIKERIKDFNTSAKELSNKWLILNNVEFLSQTSLNFFLKKLEEPRKYHTFILTNNIELLPQALISRMHTYFFPSLKKEKIADILQTQPGRQHLIKSLEHFPFKSMFEIETYFIYALDELFSKWFLKTNDLADLYIEVNSFLKKISDLPDFEKNYVISFVLSYLLYMAVKTKEYGHIHYVYYLDKIKCKFAPGILNANMLGINKENQFKTLLSSIYLLKKTVG